MVELIEWMVKDGIVKKSDLGALVRRRPPLKINLANMIETGIITEEKVQEYIAKKIREGVFPIKRLHEIEQEGVNVEPIMKKVAEELHIKYIDLDEVEIDIQLFNKVPYSQLTKYHAIPIEETDLNVVVVFEDPLDMGAQDAIQRLFPRKPIVVATSLPKKINEYLQRMEISESLKGYIDEIRKDLREGSGVDKGDEESPAVMKLIELIIRNSIFSRASDIHIEATERNCIVRDRIDGMLQQSFIFDKDIFNPLSSRMKLLANLDIAEKRKPQDGRFTMSINQKEYDFRVSTLPTLFGESIVLRILDKTKAMIRLEDAGMSKFCYDRFREGISAPYGIVLVTGPTGSGKTTTLYGALNAIKDVKDKIITVEDPVEYQMAGLQQVQVNPQAGLTFAAALRAILRQDPDKIMIGEIRDAETLRIAIQAALTGHLVLSTLHTNDAISAVTRIVDMGIESYLVSGALVAIQAQRLVRKICPHCKVKTNINAKLLEEIKPFIPENPTFYKGEGCKECNHTGYMGREMISEVLTVSDKISRMIAADASKEEITKQAMEEGFITMFEDGIKKALEGKTTVDEVFRVARL